MYLITRKALECICKHTQKHKKWLFGFALQLQYSNLKKWTPGYTSKTKTKICQVWKAFKASHNAMKSSLCALDVQLCGHINQIRTLRPQQKQTTLFHKETDQKQIPKSLQLAHDVIEEILYEPKIER